MELKEGMYVRTKDGYIAKFIKAEKYLEDGETIETTSYQFDHNIDKYGDCVNYVYAEDMIVKEPSYNIIDLIEEHDILLLFAKEYDEKYKAEVILDSEDFKSIVDYEQTNLLNLEYELITEEHIKLLSIVTKEQFSQMEYKVGD